MTVFELVGRAYAAHGALVRHLVCSNPVLDHSLELTNAIELQAHPSMMWRPSQLIGRESARPWTTKWQVETLEAQIAELQVPLAQARHNLARAEGAVPRVQAEE
ncbi:hypothetical protein ACLB2K_026514 [Fragaria x ananassa]